ncbi:MAG: DNA-directed RNA polymerase subunit omega [Clostridia bacterium]|nr:DNA-directed RNA polymerase subunit omega [Clostridia bacterium]
MLYPEISKLMEGMDSRYSLVIATAKRARQIANESNDDKTVSRAINEIANKKVKVVPADGDSEE